MPRVRPSEHAAVMALLDAPAESVADLATDVILAIDELRAKRIDWFVIVVDPGVCVHLHGPYITKRAAEKEIERGDIYAASAGATALIVQLLDSVEEGLEA